MGRSVLILPSLDLAEVKGHRPVGAGLLAHVLGVAADVRRHVVAWKREG